MLEFLTLSAAAERWGAKQNAYDVTLIDEEIAGTEQHLAELETQLPKSKEALDAHLRARPELPGQISPGRRPTDSYAMSLVARSGLEPDPDRAQAMRDEATVVRAWATPFRLWEEVRDRLSAEVAALQGKIERLRNEVQQLSDKRDLKVVCPKDFAQQNMGDPDALYVGYGDQYERGRFIKTGVVEWHWWTGEFELDASCETVRFAGPARAKIKRLRAFKRVTECAVAPTGAAQSHRDPAKADPRDTTPLFIAGLEAALAKNLLTKGKRVKLTVAYHACLKALGRTDNPPGSYDAFCKNCKRWLIANGLYG